MGLGGLENERKKTQERLDEVLPEVQKMQDKLAEAKKLLDDEVLKKADLENHCQRLDEELKFKIQLLSQQLDEVKTRKEIEITEMDGKLQEEYEDRLQKALNELREVYDKQMAQNREDFGKLYESRVQELQTALTSERGKARSSNQALDKSRRTRMLHTELNWQQRTTRFSAFLMSSPISFRSTRTSWTPRLPWTWRLLSSDAFLSLRKIDSALLVQMPSMIPSTMKTPWSTAHLRSRGQ